MLNINFKKQEVLLLVGIVILGAFLYLYKLSDNPPGLYLDEVGTGYNAYSILKTGKDEYGKFFPLAMRLFGSYTPPLYVYLTVPIMSLFGLSIFSTRLVSAICGVLAIFVVFFIIKELKITKSKYTPLIGTLFFAITPWTVFFSRIGYEQNLAYFFFCLSVLAIIKSLKTPKFLLFALPLISISSYADFPLRYLSPLLFFGIPLIFRKKLLFKNNLKYLLAGSLIAFFIQIPNLYVFTTPAFFTKSEHFYTDTVISQTIKLQHFLPSILAYPLALLREFLSQYSAYLSPRSLFFLPDQDAQRSIPELSVFYSWMIIPYVVGLYFVWKHKKIQSIKLLIFLLLITPLPGALTKQPFHIQRTLTLLLPLTLVLTVGIDNLVKNLKLKILLPIILGILVISLIQIWRSYFVLLPSINASIWGFGYKSLAEYISSHPSEIFVIDQSTRSRPQDIAYIQLAFYLKLDPKILQDDQDAKIVQDYYNQLDFSFVHKLGNIETRPIDWGEACWRNNVVFVGDTVSISDNEVNLHNLVQVFEIKDPNDNIILRGFKAQTN